MIAQRFYGQSRLAVLHLETELFCSPKRRLFFQFQELTLIFPQNHSFMSTGVIYIATGKRFIDEARNAAASLKRLMPDVCITLFSDENVGYDCFDDFVRITAPNHGFFDKY